LDHCSCGSKENGKKNSKKRQHKVSFVDDDKIAEVHFVSEASDDPPILNTVNTTSPWAGYFGKPASSQPSKTLKINFDQPVSDYLEFYRKLSQINVCLENLVIVSNMQLVGTIKTKNIACRKAVNIRCTFDSWKTFCDIEAKRLQNDPSSCQYDTYEFCIRAPTNLKPAKPSPVQFAICYHADDQEYWDNNGGHNYEIDVVIVTAEDIVEQDVMSCRVAGSLSEYAVWSDADDELPYW
jgi:Carbohydrate/starch-binding module (family 21)